MVRIYCPSGYTYRNRGDALLIMSLDALLVERFGVSAERTYATMTPAADTDFYGLPCVPLVVRLDGRYFSRVTRLARHTRRPDRVYVAATVALLPLLYGWALVGRAHPGLALRLLPSWLRSRMEPMLAADVVVAVPGGYLLAPVVTNRAIAAHVLTLATASFLGKHVTLSPCSIGPAAGWYEPLLGWLLRRIELVVLRETTSLAWVRARVGSGTDVRLATDLAFVDAVPPEPLARVIEPRTVGISVKRHSYPRSKDPVAAHAAYVLSVAAFVQGLPADREVVFVPQVTAGGDNDLRVAQEVVDLLPEVVRARVTVEDPELTPGQLRSLYGRVEVLVGTRMHANIISLLARTPVVAIAYESKTRGIMSRLGLEQYVVDIEDVTAEGLGELLARVEGDRQRYLQVLDEKLPELRAEARSWLVVEEQVRDAEGEHRPSPAAPVSPIEKGVKSSV